MNVVYVPVPTLLDVYFSKLLVREFTASINGL